MNPDTHPLTVPGVNRAMLDPDFWITRMKKEDAFTPHDVNAIRNRLAFSNHLADLNKIFRDFSNPSRWIADEGLPVPEGYLSNKRLLDSELREQITANTTVRPVKERFGFSIGRAPIGAWATPYKIFRSAEDREFDQVQQTALHTFEPVLILGESPDQEWYLVQSRTYQGWIQKSYIAWCEADVWERYVTVTDPVVVIGRGVSIEPDPYDENPLPRPLEFGAWLPQSIDPADVGSRQDPIWHHVMDVPFRKPDGQLAIRPRLIARSTSVVSGFLPTTRQSVVTSAFALLGDRYGWGDSFDRHDCSSFIMDVYRTIGIQLPRNSKAQSLALPMRTALEPDWEGALSRAHAGDELYMPGHVMLYLGAHEGQHFAIHAFVGYSHGPGTDPVLANQVMVTPLSLHLRRGEKRYGDALTSVHAILP